MHRMNVNELNQDTVNGQTTRSAKILRHLSLHTIGDIKFHLENQQIMQRITFSPSFRNLNPVDLMAV